MNTVALIVARSKTALWLRLPEVHAHRILTVSPATLPDAAAGDEVPVTVTGDIHPAPSGWTATVEPRRPA